MKKMLIAFLAGIVVGMGYFLTPSFKTPSPMDTSVAQIAFEKVNEYRNEVDVANVLSLIKDFADHKLPLKGEKELYEPIMEIEERKAEQIAYQARREVENFLQTLQEKPDIKEIVPDRVYVETLQEGKGDEITSESVIRLQFKEYALDGTLLKDTSGKSYTIPLSQMIKGFRLGLTGARVGESRKIYVHPEYGFGKRGRKALNKMLIYEVTILGKV